MPKMKWEDKERLPGHCVLDGRGLSHHHTRELTEQDKRWYLDRQWTVSRFCQKLQHKASEGNPDQTWASMDC